MRNQISSVPEVHANFFAQSRVRTEKGSPLDQCIAFGPLVSSDKFKQLPSVEKRFLQVEMCECVIITYEHLLRFVTPRKPADLTSEPIDLTADFCNFILRSGRRIHETVPTIIPKYITGDRS